MKKSATLSLAVLSALAGASTLTNAAETTEKEGFIEGSSLSVLNRNFYFNRDNRNGERGAGGAGYSEAWAHAVIAKFESGFTQGTAASGSKCNSQLIVLSRLVASSCR
ncbi:outer membrane porin, OprD family [Pseudomonas juntendi]|nr:outer membrane porin, OprD family [Pseudomonas juntendi]MBA6140772.1 outer membrane porin, OprD family [Pseudomonas monteilii]